MSDQKLAAELVAGDIIELGVVVFDVLAVNPLHPLGREAVVVALRQRHRDRKHEALLLPAQSWVRLCSPHEGIPEGTTVAEFERRRLRDELEALSS